MKNRTIKTMLAAGILLMMLAFTACTPAETAPQEKNTQTTATTEAIQITGSEHDGETEQHDSGNSSGKQYEPKQDVTMPQEKPLPSDEADIGAAKAKAIALARVPGATEADIISFEREYDDGFLNYEGEIWYGGMEYEFEIDGATGTIIEWEIDD